MPSRFSGSAGFSMSCSCRRTFSSISRCLAKTSWSSCSPMALSNRFSMRAARVDAEGLHLVSASRCGRCRSGRRLSALMMSWRLSDVRAVKGRGRAGLDAQGDLAVAAVHQGLLIIVARRVLRHDRDVWRVAIAEDLDRGIPQRGWLAERAVEVAALRGDVSGVRTGVVGARGAVNEERQKKSSRTAPAIAAISSIDDVPNHTPTPGGCKTRPAIKTPTIQKDCVGSSVWSRILPKAECRLRNARAGQGSAVAMMGVYFGGGG